MSKTKKIRAVKRKRSFKRAARRVAAVSKESGVLFLALAGGLAVAWRGLSDGGFEGGPIPIPTPLPPPGGTTAKFARRDMIMARSGDIFAVRYVILKADNFYTMATLMPDHFNVASILGSYSIPFVESLYTKYSTVSEDWMQIKAPGY